MKTPQVKAMPGMTPLGVKPNEQTDREYDQQRREQWQGNASRLCLCEQFHGSDAHCQTCGGIKSHSDAEARLAAKMKPARLSPVTEGGAR